MNAASLFLALAVSLPAVAAPDAVQETPNAPRKGPPEAKVERKVAEDDNVRIEELRVRGQTESIVVKSKLPHVAPYRIVPNANGRDPSQPTQAAGQRLWQVPLSF